jgi:hypothetical protein
MQYSLSVGAQLIGEEPRFELCRCIAFSAIFLLLTSFITKFCDFSTSFAKNRTKGTSDGAGVVRTNQLPQAKVFSKAKNVR